MTRSCQSRRLGRDGSVAVAHRVASLAGGALALSVRALEVADAGDLRLACQLAEWAAGAIPDADPQAGEVHANRAEVYRRRRDAESSLMSKGIFGTAASASEERTGG